jgi:glutamine synthetase
MNDPLKTLQSSLPEPLQTWLNGRMIDEVECVIPDIVGFARGKAMPTKKFAKTDAMYLSPSLFFQTVSGDYAELDWDDMYTEADMMMVPDISTSRAVPWTQDPTIQVICDLYNQDGSPVGFAPRNVLKRVLSLYAAEGWTPVVAPEMEFYLTQPNLDPKQEIEPPVGRTGRPSNARQAYSISGVDEFGLVVDDIYDFAEAQGLQIDTIIREDGAGQLEINLMHGDPLELADEVFTYKRMIREAALRHECYATFMAKPIADQPGSAMHIHQSVLNSKTGENIFSKKDGSASTAFSHFIGGLQTYLPSVLLVLAPYVNSYRRLVPQQAAPINLEWGQDNRTVGLREPISKPHARRVENRVVGMDANPYLAIAATLACGYLGLKEKCKARKPVSIDAYELPHSLPRSVLGAVALFEAEQKLYDVLGKEFCELFVGIKKAELDEFLQVISTWERQHLMLTV